LGQKRKRKSADSGRFVFLWCVIVIALLIISGRLVQLQVVDAAVYAQLATEQRTRDIPLPAQRGAIFDREGEPLAVSVQAFSVFADPRAVEDASSTAQAIARVLGGDPAVYAERMQREGGFVYIARKVDVERAEALRELELAGVGFHRDSRRVYPHAEVACQVLGFVGVDDVGLAGLEKYYDDLLAGTPGRLIAERDPGGRPIPGAVISAEEPVDGEDITLTIDRDIQHQAQLALAQAVDRWDAKGGNVIVMDPDTGAILAMASYPFFDPNLFASADQAAFRNRAITDAYEPGSTLKSLTTAAVLEAGIFDPESMFDLPPTIQVGGRTIGEARPRGFMRASLTEIHARSSNVGTVMMGTELGSDALYESMQSFGLTQSTGIDFSGEAVGFLPRVSDWSASTLGTVSFGQGISVTPLQIARAFSAIASDGRLPNPHFRVDAKSASATRQVAISEQTAVTMREVMASVVTSGTGLSAAVQGYEVAGKTGTAQKVKVDGRGYEEGKYIASFGGFLPVDDPRLVILVNIDEPSGAIFGGTVAAPTFAQIASFAVSHLRIPPSATRSDDGTATIPADR